MRSYIALPKERLQLHVSPPFPGEFSNPSPFLGEFSNYPPLLGED
jgi:hypothetical protein